MTNSAQRITLLSLLQKEFDIEIGDYAEVISGWLTHAKLENEAFMGYISDPLMEDILNVKVDGWLGLWQREKSLSLLTDFREDYLTGMKQLKSGVDWSDGRLIVVTGKNMAIAGSLRRNTDEDGKAIDQYTIEIFFAIGPNVKDKFLPIVDDYRKQSEYWLGFLKL